MPLYSSLNAFTFVSTWYQQAEHFCGLKYSTLFQSNSELTAFIFLLPKTPLIYQPCYLTSDLSNLIFPLWISIIPLFGS